MSDLIFIKEEELSQQIEQGITLLRVSAEWCQPCKAMEPLLISFAETHSNVKILSIDADENKEFVKQYSIKSVPTFLLFKDGQLINKKTGTMNKEGLENFSK